MIVWAITAIVAAIAIETCEHVAFKQSTIIEKHKVALQLLGIVFYLCQLATWLFALAVLPLSVATPLMGLTYITIAVTSRIYLKEKITFQRWIGIFIIMVGVSLIAGALT